MDRGELSSLSFALLTTFVSGTCILVLEILGTRIISPYYGNTIYVWSSLIVVTLLALAAGYAFGGWMADRWQTPGTVYACIALSGMCLLPIPLLQRFTLLGTSSLGLAAGSLVSAFVLFSLPLFLLGSVGPQLIRLLTTEVHHVGRRAGAVYAISTLGSVVGALATGFVLAPRFGVRGMTYGLAGVLFLLAAFGLLRSSKALFLSLLLLALLSFALGSRQPSVPKDVLLQVESLYGQLRLTETPGGRTLYINGLKNSSINRKGETDFPYLHLMEMAAYFRPRAESGLMIGLGGGSLPTSMRKRYGIRFDSVEIDPGVAYIAQRYFNFRPNGELFIGDGRRFLQETSNTYDLVFVDAFTSDQQPSHLLSSEFLDLVRSRLNPNGILSINLIHATSAGRLPGAESVHRTLQHHFKTVRSPVLLFQSQGEAEMGGNIVFFASDGPLDLERSMEDYPEQLTNVWKLAFRLEFVPTPEQLEEAILLTDDYNPIDVMMAPVMAHLRWKVLRSGGGQF